MLECILCILPVRSRFQFSILSMLSWHQLDGLHKNLELANIDEGKNWPKISLHQRNINSSFIHPLAELATEHCLLNLWWRALLSRVAPLSIMEGFNLVPSTFPVRQTETRTLSCPVNFMGLHLKLFHQQWYWKPYHSRQMFRPSQ